MMAVDDETLMAFLDGELDEAAAARVESALAADEALRARLEVQRRVRERLAAHYGPIAAEEVPERFRRILAPNVTDLAAARARRAAPLWQKVSALAATLVLGLLLGRGLAPTAPVALDGGVMVARGELAQALDTRLASEAAEEGPRIGVTFARADDSLCRTFEADALAGLACREGEAWRLVATAAAAERGPAGEYRQAGSGGALVLEAAQELMAGEPLDAEAERRARDSGWHAIGAD